MMAGVDFMAWTGCTVWTAHGFDGNGRNLLTPAGVRVGKGLEGRASNLLLNRIGGEIRWRHRHAMQVSEQIQCPFCGQSFELLIDTSVAQQRFTTDCEICCRPFEVVAECEPGEILSLDVLST